MSRDMWTFIEHKNDKTNRWEPVDIYIKNGEGKFIPEPVDTGNADYNLFNVIWDNPHFDGQGLDAAYRQIPNDLGEEASKFFDKEVEHEFDSPRKCNTIAWFDWTELKLLQKTEFVMIPDFFQGCDKGPKVNGMKEWFRQIEMRLTANSLADANPGEVRILAALI